MKSEKKRKKYKTDKENDGSVTETAEKKDQKKIDKLTEPHANRENSTEKTGERESE